MASSVYTLAEIEEFLAMTKKSYMAVLSGQDYEINVDGKVRKLTRADAPWLKGEMQYWAQEKAKCNSGQSGIPTTYGTFIET